MKSTTYTIKFCEDLINNYVNKFLGQCTTLEEGVLGLGKILLHSAEGKKTIVITEVYLNEWASGHTIRMYNKCPKKYQQNKEK